MHIVHLIWGLVDVKSFIHPNYDNIVLENVGLFHDSFPGAAVKKKKQNCLEYYNGAQSPLTWSKSSNKASGDFEQVGGTYAVH